MSIDGPEAVHNLCRFLSDGTGSFSRTIHGIKKLQRNGISLAAEATVTLAHFTDYTPEDLHNFFSFFENIGINCLGFFVDTFEALENEEHSLILERFVTSLVDFYFSILQLPTRPNIIITNVLNAIINILAGKPDAVCFAGFSQIFISSIGDIYPCQLYYSAKSEKLGDLDNVSTLKEIQCKNANNIENRIPSSCTKCVYYNLCSYNCPGSNLLSMGSESTVNEAQCIYQKFLLQRIIYNLGMLGKDPLRIKYFEKNIQEAVQAAQDFVVNI